ncbi:MAG: response regulator [Nitrospinales bacterium]
MTSKILLVEDNAMNRDMLLRRLQRKGYQVVAAEDGVQGVSKALAETPELILMDMSLPEMDGWEAARQLKAHPKTQFIPILGLSAHAMVGDREKAMNAGCDDYDTKPVEFERLLDKISTLMDKERPMPDTQIINKQAALALVDGDEELFLEIARVFLDEAREYADQLRTALDAQNAEEVERYAHTLKGTAANICAAPFKNAALDIERAAANKDLHLAVRLHARFEREFQRLIARLAAIGVS